MTHNPGFLKLVETARTKITEWTVEEVKERLDQGETLYFLDVREDHEFAQGCAEGATHLGRGILERDIETTIPHKDSKIVLYCGGGYRSALAAANLRKMGYAEVISMKGGIKAWKEAGFPITTAQPN